MTHIDPSFFDSFANRGDPEDYWRKRCEAMSDLVEVAAKLIAAHPRDLGRAMMSDGGDSFYRKHNLYPSPAIEAGKPVYSVVQYAKGSWAVHKCRSSFRDPNTGKIDLLYEWLWPATQDCRSRAEAMEWMRADAEGRRPDFSKFARRFDRSVSEEFDARGKPFRRPAEKNKARAKPENITPETGEA